MTAALRTRPVPAPRPSAESVLVSTAPRELVQCARAVTVEGPGGTGKSVLLEELADAHRAAGRTVVDAWRAPHPAEAGEELALVVDDAHLLDEEVAGRIARLLHHPGTRVVLAFRPFPRPAPLAQLLKQLGGDRRPVVLAHADHRVVTAWTRRVLGDETGHRVADQVVRLTGGLPDLVHRLLQGLARTEAAGRPARGGQGQPPRLSVPPEVVEHVRCGLLGVDDDAQACLHALAAGAPLDLDLLAELLDVPVRRSAALVAEARASGWLLPDGRLIPLVRRVVLADTPGELTRGVRRRLLGLLLRSGAEPVELARALATDGVRDPRVAELLERRGAAALAEEPALAGELLAEATLAGAPPDRLAARRAQAAALCGDLDAALRLADEALVHQDVPDRTLAADVAAAVLARRGLPARSAELFRLAGPDGHGSAALELLTVGDLDGARQLLAESRADGRGAPSMLAGARELMTQGVLESLQGGPDASADAAAALSTLTRAATLLEPVGRRTLLPDTPSALAALVALHCGELDVAESSLRRAVAADIGGPAARPRHSLLLAWVAMLRGRLATARRHVEEARTQAGDALEPRDELYAQALDVGLARRASDVAGMVRAWVHAREAVLRCPVELFALLPLGELVVAAARLQDTERLRPHVGAAEALLDRLGRPPLWATPLHWSGAQAAILTDDPESLRPHAAALVAAARTSPYAATLAGAGRTWLRVLTGQADAATVVTTAEQLAGIGLAWDGSRLAGQAAARATDPRERTALLSCARALSEIHGVETLGTTPPATTASTLTPSVPTPPPAASAPCQLSEREQEVARLVVAGKTYREIGAQLFISAKTVEHHISRMRQRLGASNRSDLLARLRAELAG
ncbi:LuxR C-terminal-related transcriptional regulator [Blastococcus sp. SYSU D00669]